MLLLILILNMASQAFAQGNIQNQQIPTPDLKSPQAQQAIQNSINQKFSVYGGTVTGNVYINGVVSSSSGFVSYGNSNGGNDYCFHDGTCQNTASLVTTSTFSFNSATSNYTVNATSLGVCITNSTFTFTVNSSTNVVHLFFNGVNNCINGACTQSLAFLANGRFITVNGIAESSSQGVKSSDAGSTANASLDFTGIATGLGPGTVNFCVTTATTAGSNGQSVRGPYSDGGFIVAQ